MAKVYIVTFGSYSDYAIDKVFLDEVKAELYKDNQNRTNNYNDYRVEIYDSFDDNITDANMKYVYYVEVHPKTSNIIILNREHYPTNEEIIMTSSVEIEIPRKYIDPEDEDCQDNINKFHININKKSYYYRINIVTPKLLTYNQLEKIVYDRIAEYEAKENNI